MPFLFAIGAIIGIIAAIIKFVGKDTDALQWLLIVGLIVVGVAGSWGFRAWWTGRSRTGA